MEKFYKKIFSYTSERGIILTNDEPVEKFVEDKFYLLSGCERKTVDARCPDEGDICRSILKDFIRIYEYDCENAELPEIVGIFENEKDKKMVRDRIILYEDITRYLGEILLRDHYDRAHNKGNVPEIECNRLIVNYKAMYLYAVNDYFMNLYGIPQQRIIKIPDNRITEVETEICGENIEYPIGENLICPGRYMHSYGSIFIFPMFLEHFLLMALQNKLLIQGMNCMARKIQKDEIALDEGDKTLYVDFSEAIINGSGRFNGTMLQVMNNVFLMFKKYGIFDGCTVADDDIKEILVGGKVNNKGKRRGSKSGQENTLGTILHSRFAESIIWPEYYKLLKLLFEKKHLNIRNNTMHGNNSSFDYSTLYFSAIMLQLIWDMGNDNMFMMKAI